MLSTATIVVIVDHLARGQFWPESVFGTTTASNWRALEHGAWVLFEDVFLAIWIHFGLRTLWSNALQQARLRLTNELIETKVRKRTGELQAYATEMEEAQQSLQEQAEILSSQADELKRSNQSAEQANRAKSEFLANMSHEIRTPMTAILGFADILAESLERPEQLDAVTTIKRNGAYLLELSTIFWTSRRSRRASSRWSAFAARRCRSWPMVASLMRVRARGERLAAGRRIRRAIPEAIETDPTRLRQILINLIGNAIKFTEIGRVRLVVKTQYTRLDHGSGSTSSTPAWEWTEEQVSRLFTPFTQADASTTRRFGGTGLGLSISKRFAQMLDGDLSVESKLNIGSTFRLEVAVGSLKGVPI